MLEDILSLFKYYIVIRGVIAITDKYGNLVFCEHSKFKDNHYSFHSWNAPVIQNPYNVFPVWNDLKVTGKIVKHFRTLGYCWDDLDAADIQMDMPFVIEFTDGSSFEFDFTDGGTIRMSANQITSDIVGGEVNVDIDKLLSDFHGKRIVGLTVQIGTSEPEDFTSAYGLDLPSQESYIEKVILEFTDNLCLLFWSFVGFSVARQVERWKVMY